MATSPITHHPTRRILARSPSIIRTSTACMSPGTGPTIARRLLMLTATATPSLSDPAPEQVTAQTGHLPGRGTPKVTTVPKVDGAVKVTAMQIVTPASMIMETQVAGSGTTMVPDSGIPAPVTGGIGMMLLNTIRTGKKVMLMATGPRGMMTPGDMTLASLAVLTMTLSPTGTLMGKTWTGAACTASARPRACAAASAPTPVRVRFTEIMV